MKQLAVALALVAASPAAAVTYDFSAYNPISQSWTGGFTYTSPTFITQDTALAPDGITCTSTVGACGTMSFFFDNGRDVLAVETGNLGTFYMFPGGTFGAVGEYDVGNTHFALTGHLSVTDGVAPVPEPGEWAMLAAGLGVAGAAARRRRVRGLR